MVELNTSERVSIKCRRELPFSFAWDIDKLKENCEDPTWEVVSGIFGALASKIFGSGSF